MDGVAIGLGVTETVMTIICIALMRVNQLTIIEAIPTDTFLYDNPADSMNMLVGTLIAFIIITPSLLTAYFKGDDFVRQSYLSPLLNAVGFILFLASGSLTINHFVRWGRYPFGQNFPNYYYDQGLALGSLMIINSVFYLSDAIYAFVKIKGLA
ncbi:unnamed protein product [Darwinula stevensoni]|uniref:Uncharacterized protein n=1 Tax=Darwinula stevensoni TaxID=69355 RepID=A0A7R8XGF2_9CRUS|nr:unnamed protein product [Darwinula stevensoni]CAG0889678.1 unnamed protein product [Darwinula stevensoni]